MTSPATGEGPTVVPSRFALWSLCRVTSPERAAAIVGDLVEDIARNGDARRWRHSRIRLESQVWRHVTAEIVAALPVLGRMTTQVFRDAWRSLRASPGQTTFIVAVLTLGVAAATVTFSVVDTVILRPLPFTGVNRIVALGHHDPQQSLDMHALASFRYPAQAFVAIRERAPAFEDLAAYEYTSQNVDFGHVMETVPGIRATAGLFAVLGRQPMVGRAFGASNDAAGRTDVAVIGYDLWQRHFGGAADVVGRTIGISGRRIVVLGVMPEGFTFPVSAGKPIQLWMPYVPTEDERNPDAASYKGHLDVIGRLAPGATPEVAVRQVSAAVAPLVRSHETFFERWTPDVVTLREAIFGDVRSWMLMVLWAVALVMGVACANAANMLLGRATYRTREHSVRAALGATRRRLAAVLVVESLLLSTGAGALGLLVSFWGVGAAKRALPAGIVRANAIALDGRVLTVAIAAAVVSGLAFGAVPAWQTSRADLVTLLKQGASVLTAARRRWRAWFLTLEIAFVCLLLVSTTFFVMSFVRIVTADLGFDRSHLVSLGTLGGAKGPVSSLLDQIRTVPGVQSAAALSASPPLVGGLTLLASALPADAPEGTPALRVRFLYVSPGYFETAQIPVIRGRTFRPREDETRVPVVVDETAARQLFGDRDPLGAGLRSVRREGVVIGVVANVKMEGPEQASGPQLYMPLRDDFALPTVLVRTAPPPSAVMPLIDKKVAEMLPPGRHPFTSVLEEAFHRQTADRRFSATVMSIFGVLVIVIGAAGIYGVMASVVAQRTREFGVRVALGASTRRIVGGVLRQTARHVLAGLAIGLAAAWWTSRVFDTVLFGVTPSSPSVYLIVAVIIAVAGLLAAILPARRAARVDPIVALRTE